MSGTRKHERTRCLSCDPNFDEMHFEADEALRTVLSRLGPGDLLHSIDDVVAEMEAREDLRYRAASLSAELVKARAEVARLAPFEPEPPRPPDPPDVVPISSRRRRRRSPSPPPLP